MSKSAEGKYQPPAGGLSERTLRSLLNETLKTLRRTKKAKTRAELLRQAVQLRADIQAAARHRLTAQLAQLDAQQPEHLS